MIDTRYTDNSFQVWAKSVAKRHGLLAVSTGNWVTINDEPCMTHSGVTSYIIKETTS